MSKRAKLDITALNNMRLADVKRQARCAKRAANDKRSRRPRLNPYDRRRQWYRVRHMPPADRMPEHGWLYVPPWKRAR